MQTSTTPPHPRAGSNPVKERARVIGEGAEVKEKKRDEKWKRRTFVILGLVGAGRGLTRCILDEHRENKARKAEQMRRSLGPLKTPQELAREDLEEELELEGHVLEQLRVMRSQQGSM